MFICLMIIIIIIYLRGLAPAGRVAAPVMRADALRGNPPTSDGCHAVPLNVADSVITRNLRGGKDYDLGLGKGCLVQRTYPV
jgi:hypothetical protein